MLGAPSLYFGTASDRYAGWIGDVYKRDYKLQRRSKKVGGRVYRDDKVPLESVTEYFEHFECLELDFPFYAPLLDEDLRPTRTHAALAAYRAHLPDHARVLVKAPELVCAPRRWTTDSGKRRFAANPHHLDAKIYTERFHRPLIELIGDRLVGILFEHGYLRRDACPSQDEHLRALAHFFSSIPPDPRYAVEERTDRLKTPAWFDLLREHGISNVFSHWTWLPPLARQLQQAGDLPGEAVIFRLLTPRKMRYADAYAAFHPFDRQKQDDPAMIADAVAIIRRGLEEGRKVYGIANNRAGGNAPTIVRQIRGELERN